MVNSFNNVYKNKKVLITGNTGFKGSWLTEWLLLSEAKVTGFANGIPTEPSLFSINDLENRINHVVGDVRDVNHLKKVVLELQPDFVFHLAAQAIVKTSYDDPIKTFTTNAVGTANVLQILREYNQNCVGVFITSDKCYYNKEWLWGYRENDQLGGKDPYSASKACAELIFSSFADSFFGDEKSAVKVCSVRAGNVIGGGDWAANRIVPDCFKAWAKGETLTIRSAHAIRPWQHVLEPLSGYLRVGQLMFEKKAGNLESFNFGPSTNHVKSVLELIKQLDHYWEKKSKNPSYKIIDNSDFHEAGLLKLNCDKAHALLNWQPNLSETETAKYTSTWYQTYFNNNYDIKEFTQNQIVEYINLAKTKSFAWT